MRDDLEHVASRARERQFQQLQARYRSLLEAVTVLAEEFAARSTMVSRECARKLQGVLKDYHDDPEGR